LRHVVNSPAFVHAQLDTALIEREKSILFHQTPLGLPWTVAAAVAALLRAEQNQTTADPWGQRDGWRLSGQFARSFTLEVAGGEVVTAELSRPAHGAANSQHLHLKIRASQDQVPFFEGFVSWHEDATGELDIQLDQERQRCRVDVLGQPGRAPVVELFVFADVGSAQVKFSDPLLQAGQGASDGGGRLTAPMPGKVISVAVCVGDVVKKGQVLAIMEAMKMEHSLNAPADGVVIELLYAAGDQLSEGVELLKLQAVSVG
jgi:3-methylcrotonyl-CoA carboxylase alpha subunit